MQFVLHSEASSLNGRLAPLTHLLHCYKMDQQTQESNVPSVAWRLTCAQQCHCLTDDY